MEEKTVERSQYIDLIKVFSTFLIVLQHSVSMLWMSSSVNTPLWIYVVNPIFAISRCGVPLFFMCSGYGMLQKERDYKGIIKSVIKLLRLYFVWMLVYGIVNVINMILDSGEYTVINYINALVKPLIFGKYHVWFIFELIALYLMVPFLYGVVNKKEGVIYAVVLSVTATVFFPYLSSLSFWPRMEYTVASINYLPFCGNILYFLLGLYCGKYLEKQKTIYWIGGFIAVFLLENAMSVKLSLAVNTAIQTPYELDSICGILVSVCIFMIFKGIAVSEQIYTRIVSRICGCGIGIYLIHPLFIGVIGVEGYYSFVTAVIAYILSLTICLILFLWSGTRKLFFSK